MGNAHFYNTEHSKKKPMLYSTCEMEMAILIAIAPRGQAEVISNSKNKILATWEPFFLPGPVCGLISSL